MNPTSAVNDIPLRTFVALHVPSAIQGELRSVLEKLRERSPAKAVRWVRPENMHLTLRFIGDVWSGDLEALRAAVQQSARSAGPVSLRLAGPGCFPNALAPRVLWMGLSGQLERLAALQLAVTGATAPWGTVEKREFHPHLTLGRVATKRRSEWRHIAGALRDLPAPQPVSWQVDAVHLMQSTLAPGGSQYSTLASFPLIG